MCFIYAQVSLWLCKARLWLSNISKDLVQLSDVRCEALLCVVLTRFITWICSLPGAEKKRPPTCRC